MDKAARLRWGVLLGALALTLGAMVYPIDQAEDSDAVVSAERIAPHPASVPSSVERDFAEPSNAETEEVDPFAPRRWQAAQPATVATGAVAASSVEGPPAPPAPPPLPYQFMGRLDDGGVEVVYLSKGEQSLIARDGETLDGAYKIIAMHAQQIEFEYLPTGDKQTLTIPASEK